MELLISDEKANPYVKRITKSNHHRLTLQGCDARSGLEVLLGFAGLPLSVAMSVS